MYRSDNFKQKETMSHAFYHSCLGKIVILAIIVAILLLLAMLTKPSKKTMIECMRHCLFLLEIV